MGDEERRNSKERSRSRERRMRQEEEKEKRTTSTMKIFKKQMEEQVEEHKYLAEELKKQNEQIAIGNENTTKLMLQFTEMEESRKEKKHAEETKHLRELLEEALKQRKRDRSPEEKKQEAPKRPREENQEEPGPSNQMDCTKEPQTEEEGFKQIQRAQDKARKQERKEEERKKQEKTK